MNQLLENLKKDEFIVHLKNILGADLADMQLISKYNKGIYYVPLIFLANMHGLFL